MSNLSKKYQELIDCLEKNIKDPKELNFVKGKLAELTIYYSDVINKFVEMEKNLGKAERNIKRLETRIDNIEDDIYVNADENEEELEEFGSDQMHDNDFEFEITCPYCDYEFITDNSYRNASEIKCPKCNKMIELDWENDEACIGDCNSCESHCYVEKGEEKAKVAEDDEEYSVDVKEPKDKEENKSEKENNENEDDM